VDRNADSARLIGKRGYCDLVRLVDKDDDLLTLERMDGYRFWHRIKPEDPQAA
jgi:hypothetical protein